MWFKGLTELQIWCIIFTQAFDLIDIIFLDKLIFI